MSSMLFLTVLRKICVIIIIIIIITVSPLYIYILYVYIYIYIYHFNQNLCVPEQLSRYSDSLLPGRCGNRIPVEVGLSQG